MTAETGFGTTGEPDETGVPVALAFGANLGDSAGTIRAALDDLEQAGDVTQIATSSFYETPPWGFEDQPAFVNLVAVGRTRLSAEALLDRVRHLEKRLGRTTTFRWGPRVIDIDILTWGDRRVDGPTLALPHPRALERAFVMAPLAEVQPDWRVGGIRAEDAALVLDRSGLKVIAPPWRPPTG